MILIFNNNCENDFVTGGNFESDALLVPPKCRFQHMHSNTECQSHDDWKKRASDKCAAEDMVLNDYGVLIPCGTGLFTGVEFVCCPDEVDSERATDAIQVEIQATSTSVLEGLKSEITKFAKLAEGASVGRCLGSDCLPLELLELTPYYRAQN